MYAPAIHQDYPTTDASDQNDAWNDAIIAVYEKFNISAPLHVWENGFVQGDASDAEIQNLVTQLGAKDADALYDELNRALGQAYRTELEKVS